MSERETYETLDALIAQLQAIRARRGDMPVRLVSGGTAYKVAVFIGKPSGHVYLTRVKS